MRISLKSIVWAWVVLLLSLGALVFSAYIRLNPESLVQLLNEQVKKNYPGSTLSVEKIDYGLSLDFTLKLKNLSLIRNSKSLARAKEVELKIPWWLVIMNDGHAHINIKSLSIYVSPKDVPVGPENDEQDLNEKVAQKIELNLPKYLVDAKYTLRAKKISIRDIETRRSYFTLSKLLVREFQYGSNSAFEINVPINIYHRAKKYVSELWLFGDVTPNIHKWVLNYRGEFKTKDMSEGFQFEDLIINGKSNFSPSSINMTSLIDLSIDRKKIGEGKVSTQKTQLNVDLKLSEFPLDYLSLLGDEIKNPFLKKIDGKAQGELTLIRPFSSQHTTTLTAKISFPGHFFLHEKSDIPGQWHLSFANNKLETSFMSRNGDVSFSRRSIFDLDKIVQSQYNQEIGFIGFPMKEAMLAVEPLGNFLETADQILHSSVVSLKKCTDEDKLFDGRFYYGVFPEQKFYQADLKDLTSKMLVNFQSKASSYQLRMDFKQFQMRSYHSFLSPYVSMENGILDGKVEGDWKTTWADGIWNLSLKTASVVGLNGEFAEFNQKFWDNFQVDSLAYQTRQWNGYLKGNVMKISKMNLEGSDSPYLTGVVFVKGKSKSHLTLIYPKNKKWKPVKKEMTEIFWQKDTI